MEYDRVDYFMGWAGFGIPLLIWILIVIEVIKEDDVPVWAGFSWGIFALMMLYFFLDYFDIFNN